MKIIVNTVPFKDDDIFPVLNILTKLELLDIELHMNFLIDQNKEKILKIKNIIKQNKIKIHSISGGWCDFYLPDNTINKTFESIDKQVKIIKELNCKRLRLFLGLLEEKYFDEIMQERVIKNLLNVSEKYPSIEFLFETHDGISLNSKITKKIFSKINKKNISINFDPANIEKANLDSYQFLKDNYKFIKHVHIKGLKTRKGKQLKDYYCAYGEGILNYTKIIKYLKNKKYSGALSVEFEGWGNPCVEILKSVNKLKGDIK